MSASLGLQPGLNAGPVTHSAAEAACGAKFAEPYLLHLPIFSLLCLLQQVLGGCCSLNLVFDIRRQKARWKLQQ